METNKTGYFRKYFLISLFLLMSLYRAFILVGFRGTSCPSVGLTPTLPCEWYNVSFELILWGIVLILFLLELIWDHDFKPLFYVCKKFWLVFVFVLLAIASLIWSVLPEITLYKVSVLILCTVMAIYTGCVMGSERFLNILNWFLAVICISNLIFVSIFPDASRWGGPNLWNGVFWHKIYLGAFMALAIIIALLKLLDWKKISVISKLLNVSMLSVAIFLILKSGSITALITSIAMTALCLILVAWIRWGKYLKPIHYFFALGIMIAAFGLIIVNLDHIFNLLGRNASLTGRVPMWIYLIRNVVSKRPILGYGYDAFWNLEGFREQMTSAMGFGLQVSQSDNGLMEILLHLGGIGLVLLLGLIVIGFIRGIKFFRANRTITSSIPLVLMVYAMIVNVAVSILLETDSFVWTVVLASQATISAPAFMSAKTNPVIPPTRTIE